MTQIHTAEKFGRVAYLDSLRSLAIFQVVLAHSAVLTLAEYPDNLSAWLQANFYHCFSPDCVPIFVLMSGALTLTRPGKLDFTAFYRQRLPKLLIPLIFWTLIYVLWKQFVMSAGLAWGEVLLRLSEGRMYGPLWFLWRMVGLTLITPYIKVLYDNLSKRQINFFILFWIIFTFIKPITKIYFNVTPGMFQYDTLFSLYTGYFVLGAVIHNLELKNKHRDKYVCLAIFIFSSLCLYFLSREHKLLAGTLALHLFVPENILVLIQSVSLYLFVKLSRETDVAASAFVTRLGRNSFAIYLVHLMLIEMAIYLLRDLGLLKAAPYPWLGVPLLALTVLFASNFLVSRPRTRNDPFSRVIFFTWLVIAQKSR